MDTASTGVPFLDELRRKWQEGALPAGQALRELALWEDDAANRTGTELDAAWAMRSEIEASASGSIPPSSPPPISGGETAPPSTVEPASRPVVNEDEDEVVYDSIPRLRDIAAEATAARSRREWERTAALRAEAEKLISQHATENGTRLPIPDNLAATFTSATEAQEAERLVDEADIARRKGDFSEAAYRLAEASRLDPRYTPLSSAQQLVSDLQRTVRDLRDNSLGSVEELVEARKLARRLLEEDASPESEFASKKLADIEAEIGRRVETSKQYAESDLTTIDEPGSLDDKLECIARVGSELAKVETLRADAPFLSDLRSRYLGARRQLDRLKPERDNLLVEIGNLDPQKGFEAARVGGIMQRLEALAAAPLANGDRSIGTAAQNLIHRLNAYLSSRLSGNQVDVSALNEYEQILALSQRGPQPLSAQQVNTYGATIQRARGANQPTVAMPIPQPPRPGSIPPGTLPGPGSVPPQQGGTVPIPDRVGSTPPAMHPQGQQYANPPQGRPGSIPPAGGYGSTMPPQYAPPQYMPPQVPVATVTQPEARKGVPVWAWLLPLLIVLGVGGYFGWDAYQRDQTQKRLFAEAVATAQTQSTQTAVAAETATAEAIAAANTTSTAVAQETATAETVATEVAIAEATSTEIARVEGTQTAVAAETAAAQVTPGLPPVVAIETMTVEHNIEQGTEKGMLIHLKFVVDNLKGVDCKATAYFYYNTGEPLKDTNGKLTTTDGQVAVSAEFKPGFDSTQYDDLTIFVPVNELDLPAGEFNLKFNVEIYRIPKDKALAKSDDYEFNLK